MSTTMQKWSKPTAQTCKAVWGIFSIIYNVLGTLPDKKTPEVLQETTAGEILDFGEQIAEDDSLWDQMPEQVIPTKEQIAYRSAKLEQMGVGLSNTQSGRAVIAEYSAGKSTSEIRQNLRKFLDESR